MLGHLVVLPCRKVKHPASIVCTSGKHFGAVLRDGVELFLYSSARITQTCLAPADTQHRSWMVACGFALTLSIRCHFVDPHLSVTSEKDPYSLTIAHISRVVPAPDDQVVCLRRERHARDRVGGRLRDLHIVRLRARRGGCGLCAKERHGISTTMGVATGAVAGWSPAYGSEGATRIGLTPPDVSPNGARSPDRGRVFDRPELATRRATKRFSSESADQDI